ncbi:hypothetical protein [Pseudobacteriovorax antillogorgiicola]|uniref:Uncharacterized protein n=1 Tax=Pseudobacteriovorax antillogorgiicola TaxID=1513793 RepID=A0A1Y6BTA3_9BACT|nr:hypothetical protein [Pseudobacteriovorax antillogorgiicola]TCS52981.1 hypothetical protein EDD56_10832 [Pseudobacteriovorax antillogorgiicola]SMF27364.1 hypothetical protein SAMN06296036_108215 [Pseudobacteriovorax antillogorgiicola]
MEVKCGIEKREPWRRHVMGLLIIVLAIGGLRTLVRYGASLSVPSELSQTAIEKPSSDN